MKRALVGILLVAFSIGSVARAADAVTLAAKQEAEADYKRLTATIEDYATSQAAQHKRIVELETAVSKLRDEVAHNNSDTANKESIRQLGELIQKVDKARIADNERITKRIEEEMKKLGDAIKKMGAVAPPPRHTSTPTDGVAGGGNIAGKPAVPRSSSNAGPADEGFEYEVVSGDRPDKIAAKYQAEKVNVTARAIISANPTVDWTKLKVGQKLFIPKPKS